MAERDSISASKEKPVEYRDIKGFPGYRVGNDGSAWRKHRLEWKRMKGRIVSGYRYINLSSAGNKQVSISIHRLVLSAFIGQCPDGMQCCHNNGIKTDNRVANLRWDTPKANQADRSAHGTACSGERHPRAKLTAADVEAIRTAFSKRTARAASLAAKFGVSQACIYKIIVGLTWPLAGGPIASQGT